MVLPCCFWAGKAILTGQIGGVSMTLDKGRYTNWEHSASRLASFRQQQTPLDGQATEMLKDTTEAWKQASVSVKH